MLSIPCPNHQTYRILLDQQQVCAVSVAQKALTPSRFLCVECLWEYGSENLNHRYASVTKLVDDPFTLFKDYHPERIMGQFDRFATKYLPLLDLDANQIIQQLTNAFNHLVAELRDSLNKKIQQFQQMQQIIRQVKENFSSIIGHDKFQKTFQLIVEKRQNIEPQDYQHLNGHLDYLIIRVYNQEDDQFQISMTMLDQQLNLIQRMDGSNKILNFKYNANQIIDASMKQLDTILCPIKTKLPPSRFIYDILERINQSKKITSQTELLYLGTRDGLTYKAFWDKCNEQQYTLMFLYAENGETIGAYSPNRWRPDSTWANDDSQSSFVFSATKAQIYPIKEKYKCYAQKGRTPSYVFEIGGGGDIILDCEFIAYTSSFGHTYDIGNHMTTKISKHLLNSDKQKIIEMEVFLLK